MTVKALSPFRLAWAQAFLATVGSGSASAAARAIGCDQSTVSRSLEQLSEFLGGELFTKENPLRLTPLGQAFLPKAEEVRFWASEVRKLKDKVAATDGEPVALPVRELPRKPKGLSVVIEWLPK